MKFTLKIDCDNAAFEDSPKREIARILRRAAERFEHEITSDNSYLFDLNGNRVGTWEITQ